MWTKTPLAVKITVPLILMQVSGIVFGGYMLTDKIEKMRQAEIDAMISKQSDLVEESLRYSNGLPRLATEGEMIREMDHDPHLFFFVVGPDDKTIFSSQGPQPRIRERIRTSMLMAPNPPEDPYNLFFFNEKWRGRKEALDDGHGRKHPIAGSIFIAIDVKSATAELGMIRKMIIAAAILLAVLTALASVAVVSLTTSNLRLFAKSLGAIDPLSPVWSFKSQAQSKEERLLFTSFQTLIEQIRRARQKQSLFIASASHELKTPVAAMMAALEVLLAKERNVADYQRVCHDLLKTTRDLRRLTGTLLSMALLEGDAARESAKLDLCEILSSICDRWLRDARAKGIQLQAEIPEEPSHVLGNRELLEVALGNFVDNALKYSPSATIVTIRLLRSVEDLEVHIQDQGIGIAPTDVEKLGDLFFRADPSRADLNSFGLGFSHAKRILSSFGATVQVVSELKKGTEVIVCFPRA